MKCDDHKKVEMENGIGWYDVGTTGESSEYESDSLVTGSGSDCNVPAAYTNWSPHPGLDFQAGVAAHLLMPSFFVLTFKAYLRQGTSI